MQPLATSNPAPKKKTSSFSISPQPPFISSRIFTANYISLLLLLSSHLHMYLCQWQKHANVYFLFFFRGKTVGRFSTWKFILYVLSFSNHVCLSASARWIQSSSWFGFFTPSSRRLISWDLIGDLLENCFTYWTCRYETFLNVRALKDRATVVNMLFVCS